MADVDFNINIRTIADTTGIRLTEQGLNSIKVAALQGNKEAIASMQQLTAASSQLSAVGVGGIGLAGGLGIGLVTGLVGGLINQFRLLDSEQEKMIAEMEATRIKMKQMGDAIIEVQDKMIEARRLGAEPLGQQYIDLQQKLVRLTTEQGLLNLPSQAKEWNDLQKEINETGNAIEKVQSQLEKKGITDVTPVIAGPKAGKGESQALVDEIERNRKAAEEQLKEDIWEYDPETGGMRRTGKKQFPIFQPPPPPPLQNPAPNEAMLANPINDPNNIQALIYQELQKLNSKF